MKVTINVTQEDINNGTCVHASRCAIALAVNRVLKPGFISAATQRQVVMGDPYGEQVYYSLLPPSAREFIWAFDDDKKGVKPISFELDIPEEALA